ncbi:MAG: DHH family phosphoesterase [Candidatus Diapherotrites archaeon]|nr:DHH family phosphoesterase [Candidatus Diapherotrites archaeon]
MEKKLLQRFKEFLKGIEDCELFYHRDADGLCSAVLFAKALEKLGKQPCKMHALESYEMGTMPTAKASNIVFLDLSIDSKESIVRELEKRASVLIIDHHKVYADINSEKVLMIKPQMLSTIEPSSYPASKLTYDLCSGIVDLSMDSWIASVGIIGDMSYETWKRFVDESAKKAGVTKRELESIAELVNAVQTLAPERFAELFELFMLAMPEQILNHKLNELRYKLKEELTYWKEEFKKKSEHYAELELYFFYMKPQARIKSALIDELTKELPNQTIIIVEDLGEATVKFSARRQDFKIKMNELLEKAVQGIPRGEAGGHVPAAAGSVPRAYLKKFKENLLAVLRKKYGE